MGFPSIFEAGTTDRLLDRIDSLSPLSPPLWGRMTVSQMLEHCAVAYRPLLTGRFAKPAPFLKRLFARLFMKRYMVGKRNYGKNLPTSQQFVINGEPEFMRARDNLKDLLSQVHGFGPARFKDFEHPLLGRLTPKQWSNMLYKHLDHHLRQFGV